MPPLYARTVALSETAATRSATLSLYRLVAGATYDYELLKRSLSPCCFDYHLGRILKKDLFN